MGLFMHEAIIKKVIENLKKFWFVGGNDSPCLYVKKSEKGVVYVALYIDESLMAQNLESIDEAIATLKENGLVPKVVQGLQNYLSWKIRFSRHKKYVWLRIPHLIESMVKNFGDQVKNVWHHKTQGMPKKFIVGLTADSEKIPSKD